MTNSYEEILEEIESQGATLVAVSKTKPIEMIQELYNKGQRTFGENRVHELVDKASTMTDDIEWHMIGHLQTKKVKHLIPHAQMIHSVDTFKLANEINKQSAMRNVITDILLQVKIAEEESKYGIETKGIDQIIHQIREGKLNNIRICGVMGMATFSSDKDLVRKEFKKLKSTFEYLKNTFFQQVPHFRHISMGMSGDYKMALEEGSTMVRIGSLLFGARDYG